jgi:hypothetical protein
MQIPADFAPKMHAALKSQRHYIVRGLLTPEEFPSWHDFSLAINDAAHRETHHRSNNPIKERQVNDLYIVGLLYFYVFLNDTDKQTHFKKLLPVQDALREVFPREFRTFNMATAFMNLITGDGFADSHNDVMTHNFYVQLDGQTEWSLRTDRQVEAEIDRIVLNPGDAIFVPNLLFHAVKAQTPRTAMVFRLDIEDGPYDHDVS